VSLEEELMAKVVMEDPTMIIKENKRRIEEICKSICI
jgi:hypothetical protein